MGEPAAPPTAANRTITPVREPDERGVGVFCIAQGKKSQFYVFREIPCEIGGRGFAVHRLGQGTLYHVRVGKPEDRSCECMGFLRWGHCKHVSGLLALLRRTGFRHVPGEPDRPDARPTEPSATPQSPLPTPPRTDSGA